MPKQPNILETSCYLMLWFVYQDQKSKLPTIICFKILVDKCHGLEIFFVINYARIYQFDNFIPLFIIMTYGLFFLTQSDKLVHLLLTWDWLAWLNCLLHMKFVYCLQMSSFKWPSRILARMYVVCKPRVICHK